MGDEWGELNIEDKKELDVGVGGLKSYMGIVKFEKEKRHTHTHTFSLSF